MRALLNATEEEVNQLGGDFTHCRDWQRLRTATLEFSLLPGGPVRRGSALFRKILEKSCRTWQPTWVRRRLLLWSRYVWMNPDQDHPPDLVFSHLLFPWTRRNIAPVIWNSQGISPRRYYDSYNRGQWTVEDVASIYRKIGRKADALVIFTEYGARNVVHWCPELKEKIFVVPAPVFVNGAETPEKPSVQDGVIRALFAGIDAERKGLPEVLEAYRSLRERVTNVRLDVVSRPSARLQTEIAKLKDARLHVSSPRVDVKVLMRQSDIFLLPTHADTYALAAVEAMAYGCAVIVSDLEPLPEIIPEGEIGFNVPVGDVDSLAKRFAQLVEDRNLLRRFQDNASQRFARLHAPEVIASRLEQVFCKVLQKTGRECLIAVSKAGAAGSSNP